MSGNQLAAQNFHVWSKTFERTGAWRRHRKSGRDPGILKDADEVAGDCRLGRRLARLRVDARRAAEAH
ncbi:hypothetical protein [Gemmatimonas sp.]|uniref:hypothetical protein n=1 Tax=Gemmatimonas sp. TaxID=1962908 RepID=UPI0037BF249E